MSEIMNDNVRDILRDSAEYIAEHGWVQGQSFEGESEDVDFSWTRIAATTPGACALGSIYYISNRFQFEDMARARIALAATIEGVPPTGSLVQTSIASGVVAEWNDRPERSAEDVILMMKKAAEL